MLILYGNIYKVTRNRLPPDVRLRRGASLDRESRRPECRETTSGTPLMRSVMQRQSTATTNRLQTQPMNFETSSMSSDNGNDMSRRESGANVECFEMIGVTEERQATSLSHVRSLYERPTVALNFLRVCRRSNSSPQSRPAAVARASFSGTNLRLPPSKDDCRRSSCLVAGDVAARRENKAAKTLAIVVGGFVSCWLPFFVLYVTEPFCASCRVSDTVRSALTWLGYANSLVNPFIYATYNRHFRHSFWTLTVGRFHACLRTTHILNDATETTL